MTSQTESLRHLWSLTRLALARVIVPTLLPFALAVLMAPAPARAEMDLSGTYNCVSLEVDGRKQPCKAPSLELKPDGSYKILAEVGTYEVVKDRWLVLSSRKTNKARLEGSTVIVFEYISGGKKHRITYRRKFERPEGWTSA